MRYRVGCKLGYRSNSDTTFVFNIQVQNSKSQMIEDESLVLSPSAMKETWLMPESGNRYLRVLASAGSLLLSYEAVVNLTPIWTTPAQS
jgi:hypothetical protein